MGTVVACVTLADEGPAVLLSGHLEGEVPIVVYRVADYRATVSGLRARGSMKIEILTVHRLAPLPDMSIEPRSICHLDPLRRTRAIARTVLDSE